MKKKEKRMILTLILVAIIIIAVLVKIRNGSSNENGANSGTNGGATASSNEEFVQVLDDGSKMNTSNKLAETKTFGSYEVSNIQLTEQDGQSLILADIKNTTESKTDVTLIEITLLDKEGNEITSIGGIIGDAEPGETVKLNASATTDFANAYDLTIKVKEEETATEAE